MIVFVISLFLENEVKKVIDVGVVILSVSGNPLMRHGDDRSRSSASRFLARTERFSRLESSIRST